MYNYELCITKYSGVVGLFITTYILKNLSENKWQFKHFFKFLEKMLVKIENETKLER